MTCKKLLMIFAVTNQEQTRWMVVEDAFSGGGIFLLFALLITYGLFGKDSAPYSAQILQWIWVAACAARC